MLLTLLNAAVRGGILLIAAWVLLKVLRVRDPAVEKNTWTLVAAAGLVMPLLAWVAALVSSPVRVVPLNFLSAGPLASTAALTGIGSDASGSRLELGCALIYMAVTAVLSARLLIGLWIGARLRRRASAVPGLHLEDVDIRVSEAIRSPASFASTILLPTGWKTWDTATLNTVLAHEQAHVCNLDCYRLWLAALYRVVFWFDPLAHWLHWRLRSLSELTSDEAAAAAAGDRAAYAATLKRMASAPQFIPSTVAMADSPSLGWRLSRLLSGQSFGSPLARPRKALLMCAMLLMVALVAVPWAGAAVAGSQRPAILEFHLVDEQSNPLHAQRSGAVPLGDKLYKVQNGPPILLKRETVATSDDIAHVTVTTTQQGPQVEVRLTERGAASMLSTTRENIGRQMAAVYNGQVINHAVIRGPFGREFRITGLNAAEAHALAMKFARAAH